MDIFPAKTVVNDHEKKKSVVGKNMAGVLESRMVGEDFRHEDEIKEVGVKWAVCCWSRSHPI